MFTIETLKSVAVSTPPSGLSEYQLGFFREYQNQLQNYLTQRNEQIRSKIQLSRNIFSSDYNNPIIENSSEWNRAADEFDYQVQGYGGIVSTLLDPFNKIPKERPRLDDTSDDLFGGISSFASNVGQQVQQSYSNAIDSLRESEVGRVVADITDASVNLALTPFEAAEALSRGDISMAQESLLSAGGSAGSLVTTSFRNEQIQQLMRNEQVSTLSGGFSSDLADSSNAFRSIEQTGQVSDAQRDAILRTGIKLGAAAGAASLAPQALSTQNYATAQGVKTALDRGDYVAALTGAANLSGVDFPKRPDWLPDIELGPIPSRQPSSQDIIGGYSSREQSRFQTLVSEYSSPMILVILFGVSVYLLRKKGVI